MINTETLHKEFGGHQKRIYDLLLEKQKSVTKIEQLSNEISILQTRSKQLDLEIASEEGIIEALTFVLKNLQDNADKKKEDTNVSI